MRPGQGPGEDDSRRALRWFCLLSAGKQTAGRARITFLSTGLNVDAGEKAFSWPARALGPSATYQQRGGLHAAVVLVCVIYVHSGQRQKEQGGGRQDGGGSGGELDGSSLKQLVRCARDVGLTHPIDS